MRPLNHPLFIASALAITLMSKSPLIAAAPSFEFTPNFIKPPEGSETIGNGHGEIQVDSAGNIYVSVEGQDAGGMQVYSPEGKFLKQLKLPRTLHGFSIRKSAEGEFIFAAVLGESKVIKASLNGEILLEIPKSSFPAEIANPITLTLKDGTVLSGKSPQDEKTAISFTQKDGSIKKVEKSDLAQKASFTLKAGQKVEGINPTTTDDSITLTVGGKQSTYKKADIAEKDGKPVINQSSAETRGSLKLTSADQAPNGDIYVVDGYGTSWIFVFDSKGNFKKQFGGPAQPFGLANCHKIHVDTRFSPARIFLCDRGNKRIMHASLEGDLLGVIATGLRNPSSASFHGDHVAIAEIAGRISVWDKEGKLAAELGTNDTPGQTNTPGVQPSDWRDNVVTSPHGVTFDAKGNILETEWNKWGRVLKWTRK